MIANFEMEEEDVLMEEMFGIYGESCFESKSLIALDKQIEYLAEAMQYGAEAFPKDLESDLLERMRDRTTAPSPPGALGSSSEADTRDWLDSQKKVTKKLEFQGTASAGINQVLQ